MEQVEVLRNQALGATLVANLKKRGFDAYYCANKEEALAQAMALIPKGDVVSWGGSMTISQIGLLDAVIKSNKVIDRASAGTPAERVELMRKALLCDTFLMSSNGISLDGRLINIDGNGNRCAALIYGPKQVLVIAGMNKVAGTIEAAMDRARNVAAPINIQRFPASKTPCLKTGHCSDCLSSDTICSQFVETRFCKPQGRIKVILVGEALGY